MCNELKEFKWLYRGVPHESDERLDVLAIGEVCPPHPDRIGEYWVQAHQAGMTATGYTSWSTSRSIAIDAAESTSDQQGLSGRIVVFRVRTRELSVDRIYPGRADEDEYLIQGRIEGVSISQSEAEDDEEDNDNDD